MKTLLLFIINVIAGWGQGFELNSGHKRRLYPWRTFTSLYSDYHRNKIDPVNYYEDQGLTYSDITKNPTQKLRTIQDYNYFRDGFASVNYNNDLYKSKNQRFDIPKNANHIYKVVIRPNRYKNGQNEIKSNKIFHNVNGLSELCNKTHIKKVNDSYVITNFSYNVVNQKPKHVLNINENGELINEDIINLFVKFYLPEHLTNQEIANILSAGQETESGKLLRQNYKEVVKEFLKYLQQTGVLIEKYMHETKIKIPQKENYIGTPSGYIQDALFIQNSAKKDEQSSSGLDGLTESPIIYIVPTKKTKITSSPLTVDREIEMPAEFSKSKAISAASKDFDYPTIIPTSETKSQKSFEDMDLTTGNKNIKIPEYPNRLDAINEGDEKVFYEDTASTFTVHKDREGDESIYGDNSEYFDEKYSSETYFDNDIYKKPEVATTEINSWTARHISNGNNQDNYAELKYNLPKKISPYPSPIVIDNVVPKMNDVDKSKIFYLPSVDTFHDSDSSTRFEDQHFNYLVEQLNTEENSNDDVSNYIDNLQDEQSSSEFDVLTESPILYVVPTKQAKISSLPQRAERENEIHAEFSTPEAISTANEDFDYPKTTPTSETKTEINFEYMNLATGNKNKNTVELPDPSDEINKSHEKIRYEDSASTFTVHKYKEGDENIYEDSSEYFNEKYNPNTYFGDNIYKAPDVTSTEINSWTSKHISNGNNEDKYAMLEYKIPNKISPYPSPTIKDYLVSIVNDVDKSKIFYLPSFNIFHDSDSSMPFEDQHSNSPGEQQYNIEKSNGDVYNYIDNVQGGQSLSGLEVPSESPIEYIALDHSKPKEGQTFTSPQTVQLNKEIQPEFGSPEEYFSKYKGIDYPDVKSSSETLSQENVEDIDLATANQKKKPPKLYDTLDIQNAPYEYKPFSFKVLKVEDGDENTNGYNPETFKEKYHSDTYPANDFYKELEVTFTKTSTLPTRQISHGQNENNYDELELSKTTPYPYPNVIDYISPGMMDADKSKNFNFNILHDFDILTSVPSKDQHFNYPDKQSNSEEDISFDFYNNYNDLPASSTFNDNKNTKNPTFSKNNIIYKEEKNKISERPYKVITKYPMSDSKRHDFPLSLIFNKIFDYRKPLVDLIANAVKIFKLFLESSDVNKPDFLYLNRDDDNLTNKYSNQFLDGLSNLNEARVGDIILNFILKYINKYISMYDNNFSAIIEDIIKFLIKKLEFYINFIKLNIDYILNKITTIFSCLNTALQIIEYVFDNNPSCKAFSKVKLNDMITKYFS